MRATVDYFHHVSMVSLPGRVTDAGVALLGNLNRIDTLVIDLSSISDAGMANLDRPTSLRWLTINSALGSMDNLLMRLRRLKVLGRLRGLYLDRSSVTDPGLGEFEGLALPRENAPRRPRKVYIGVALGSRVAICRVAACCIRSVANAKQPRDLPCPLDGRKGYQPVERG
jgi:hypothetical protein